MFIVSFSGNESEVYSSPRMHDECAVGSSVAACLVHSGKLVLLCDGCTATVTLIKVSVTAGSALNTADWTGLEYNGLKKAEVNVYIKIVWLIDTTCIYV